MMTYTHKTRQTHDSRGRIIRQFAWTLAAIVLTFVSMQQTAQGLTPEETGLEIAVEMDRRDADFGDFTANMEMILQNRHGQKSVRHIRTRTLEVPDDGDKILIVFDKPRDIKGTAFLSFTHAVKADDQWIYLPALKRVKRIASNNKSGPFMGSEFAYEDITSDEVDKYTYRYLRDEEYNGLACFVVERYPADKHSGYTRQMMWVDKDAYRLQKLEFYDRKDELLKTLTFGGYQLYLERYWRPDEQLMVNHQTGKRTQLVWRDYEFKTGLKKNHFDKNALKRVR